MQRLLRASSESQAGNTGILSSRFKHLTRKLCQGNPSHTSTHLRKLSRPTLQALFQFLFKRQAGGTPTCLNLDSPLRVIVALPAYSQLESLVEAMPGQFPVPFRSFPRVKQAIPARSPYKLLFGVGSDKPMYFYIDSCSGTKPGKPVGFHLN